MQRSPLKRGNSKLKRKIKTPEQIKLANNEKTLMWKLFDLHWQIKAHICQACGDPIWGDNLSIYHDHLLEKGNEKYEHLKYEIENLFLVCWECHTKKGNGFPMPLHKKAIEEVKIKFNVT